MKNCKNCNHLIVIGSEYGTIRRCSLHRLLLTKENIAKKRPEWCKK